mgnify:CR=1 FL=1
MKSNTNILASRPAGPKVVKEAQCQSTCQNGTEIAHSKYVVLLQNAYSWLYAGGIWPRDSWLKALHKCRSGQRLSIITKLVEPHGIELWFDNTTPMVGDEPNSFIPPDPKHIASVIESVKPVGILACGASALKAIKPLYSGPILAVPHPANRTLRNAVYVKAGQMLINGLDKSTQLGWDKSTDKLTITRL